MVWLFGVLCCFCVGLFGLWVASGDVVWLRLCWDMLCCFLECLLCGLGLFSGTRFGWYVSLGGALWVVGWFAVFVVWLLIWFTVCACLVCFLFSGLVVGWY